MLNESVHDNAALKFVFLAGGPGSGKNHLANQLFGFDKGRSFGASGMKLVSFDAIFEKLLEKHGYSKNLAEIPPEERHIVMGGGYNSLREQARRLMKKQMKLYQHQGVGIVFDGTGQVAYSYDDKRRDAEEMGYDTYLMYVDTPLSVAVERNAKRDRKLPIKMLANIYRSVKQNKAIFEKMFGDNMIVVDNSVDGEGVSQKLQREIDKIIASPVKNPIGQEFLASGGVRKIKEKPKHSWKDYKKPKKKYDKTYDDQADGYKGDTGSYGSFDSPYGSDKGYPPEWDDMTPYGDAFKQGGFSTSKKWKDYDHDQKSFFDDDPYYKPKNSGKKQEPIAPAYDPFDNDPYGSAGWWAKMKAKMGHKPAPAQDKIQSPKNTAGWTPDEVDAIKKAHKLKPFSKEELANLQKLKSRYGDKFDLAKALMPPKPKAQSHPSDGMDSSEKHRIARLKARHGDDFDLNKAMGKNPDPTIHTPQPLPTLKGALGADKTKVRNHEKPTPQGQPTAAEPKPTPGVKKIENPKVEVPNHLEKRIHNPETGNDILVTTALGYPPNHPMRIAAEKFLKK
jgi:dephospho-CoA kinase